ncbi:exonuclease V [Roridomyces roridus]|uniref:Exonuclease V n=1 Tax=Roridomyces roridus TaxID=1738132 RepID=A0AAD7C3Q5_9AGAR|nr:exonuclease V [Roridomyces roridus]
MAEGPGPDEFDDFDDFSGLTQEEFARLDAVVLTGLESLPPSGLPLVEIEIDRSDEPSTEPSPIEKCEVQVDYGLRQKRSRRLTDRPPSFRGSSGKEIVVQQDVAAKNDKTTKRGRFIHKELELELVSPGEIIEIKAATREDQWALRLFNLLSSLVSLMVQRCAREITVFGVVHGVVVVGIISPRLGPNAPQIRLSLPQSERSAALRPSDEVSAAPQHTLRVIDTKTRRVDSMPSDEDAEPARLQLMIYRRFLTTLLDMSTPFDYATFFAHLHLDPSAPFSHDFRSQMAELVPDMAPTCLFDVATLLRTRITELGIPPVDETMQIVYRSQNKYLLRPKPRATHTREEDELAMAIQMSLQEGFDTDLANALRMSLLDRSVEAPEALPGEFGRLRVVNQRAGQHQDGRPQMSTETEAKIIGTKEFPNNDAMLDEFLDSALQWWQGTRKARGVSVRQTNRCYSCEYHNDCEWREEKAEEWRQRKAV